MRKVSKTGIALVGCMIVCVILALAVGVPNGFFGGDKEDLNDDNTPGIGDMMEGETPLLIFDKSEGATALLEAIENGEVASVRLLCGEDGEIVSDDPGVVRDALKAVKNITVSDEAEAAPADGHVYFTLENGSEVGYSFIGDSIILIPDGTSKGTPYQIAGSEDLWNLYQELAGEQ